MGREIRRVPLDWEHPKDGYNRYVPMHNHTYESAAHEWVKNFDLWRRGAHPDQADSCRYYWEWNAPPDEDTCRPTFEAEALCYQVYENVTEGTPISPVFESKEQMIEWLIGQGHSEEAARIFVDKGYAFSMVFSTETGMKKGIDAWPDMVKRDEER